MYPPLPPSMSARSLSLFLQIFLTGPARPAGYVGSKMLDVTKQVCYSFNLSCSWAHLFFAQYWLDSYGNIR